MKSLKYIYDSLKGIKRNKNKDDIMVIESNNISLFILFDGVSSSENAKKGINFIKKFIGKNINNYIIDSHLDLKNLIFESNLALLKKDIVDSFSTCSAFCYSTLKNEGIIVNVGDSRIYGIFTNFRKQLTFDDNMSYNKNILTKSLGMVLEYNSIDEIILNEEELSKGNILICSDGFYNIYEKNKLLFHNIFHYKKLGNIKNRLNKEINKRNIDDSSYIYILTIKNV